MGKIVYISTSMMYNSHTIKINWINIHGRGKYIIVDTKIIAITHQTYIIIDKQH